MARGIQPGPEQLLEEAHVEAVARKPHLTYDEIMAERNQALAATRRQRRVSSTNGRKPIELSASESASPGQSKGPGVRTRAQRLSNRTEPNLQGD